MQMPRLVQPRNLAVLPVLSPAGNSAANSKKAWSDRHSDDRPVVPLSPRLWLNRDWLWRRGYVRIGSTIRPAATA